uniref:Uncharacterized protein n=1 Tax=Ignisphaera aggregans TaxID=334771 RepID=A0A7J3Z8B0_9CREN
MGMAVTSMDVLAVDIVLVLNLLRAISGLGLSQPLTKEGWERLKRLFEKNEKDELTLEEADEFIETQRCGSYTYAQHNNKEAQK